MRASANAGWQRGRAGLRWIALVILMCGWMRVAAGELMVFAAASLTDALTEIAQVYQKNSDEKVYFNFAASSILARQIEEGARADLFFSADEEKMDRLEKRKLIEVETRKELLSNKLVIVVEKESRLEIKTARDLLKVKRVAMGEPTTVPAGIYAREYFTKQKVWDDLKARIVPTENVRAALSAVAGGNVDAAVVYKTDAVMSAKVKVVLEVPAEEGPNIIYPAAVLAEAKYRTGAVKFMEFLQEDRSVGIFEKHGFVVLKAK
jgi:molybdate transport system substrate-binding protein